MRKLIKLIFYVSLIAFILSPFFIKDYGLDPEKYVSTFDIENGSFLQVDGYKTYYIDFNRNSEKTILLIHGFGGSATNWLSIIPSLADEGYRVVAVDLKGFGFSEKKQNENYSHPAQVEFLNAFVEKLELKNITIVGHSMGANVSIMYYQKYPEKVENLVLVAGAITEERDIDVFRNNLLKVLDFPIIREYGRVALKIFTYNDRVEKILNSAIYNPQDVNIQEPSFVDPTVFLNWEYVAIKMASSSYLNVLRENVSEIDAPVLIIWGQEDTWVPVFKGDYLHRNIGNSEFEVLENVGHLPMLEAPEAFLDVLINNI
jgi:pimeloyl-ACP methyl ester carboxylesterase